jgi:lysozyme
LTVCAPGPTVDGIDVSHYDGTVDWVKVKASGDVFGIAKASEGLTFIDPKFSANWAAMKSAGLVRGAYHFFRPLDDGKQQADFFLSQISGFGLGDLPPILDWEVHDTTITNALQIQRVQDFVDEVQAVTGLTTILYSSKSFLATLGSPTQFVGLPLWDARWGVSCPDIPDAWPSWTFWQYTATASVQGISGDGGVDVNHFNGTYDKLMALTGPPPVADAGSDADAGDAGAELDAGTDADAGIADAGVADAGVADAGADAGDDAGAPDAGVPASDAGGGPIAATDAVGCRSSGGAGALAFVLLACFIRRHPLARRLSSR